MLAVILLLVGSIGSIFTAKSQKQGESLEEFVEERSFNSIYLATDNSEIALIPTTAEKAKVELAGNQKGYVLTTDVVDHTLQVNLKQKRFKLFSFDLFSSKLYLTVYVPQKIYDTIQVESKNGSIKLTDLEGSDLKADTNNGRITLENIKSNSLSLESNNGQIEMNDIIATLIEADIHNGKIEMEKVEGEIAAKTNNGRITLATDNLDRPLDLHSDNGKIEIYSKEKPTNAILDIKVNNGKVRVFDEKDWDTVIGNGENTIKLKTNNGSITLSH